MHQYFIFLYFSLVKHHFPLWETPFTLFFPLEMGVLGLVLEGKRQLWTQSFRGPVDKLVMNSHASFRQILNEKLGISQEEASSYQGEIKSDPAHMAFLIGQIGRFDIRATKNNYPRPMARPQRKAHVLSASEALSFEYLKVHNLDLSPAFTEAELKKAFRHSAFILHPDQGGSTEQFVELKAHYENLKPVLARKNAAAA